MSKTVLVTGTNRGVGLEIATQFLARGYTVISGVRNPEKQQVLSATGNARHLVVHLDVSNKDTISQAIDTIRTHQIKQLDIVVNNAAMGPTTEGSVLVRNAKAQHYTEQWHTNFIGTLELFASVYPLLPTDGTGKFIVLSTYAAVNSMEHWPLAGAYTTSKNAFNYLIGQIHSEEKQLTAFTISPGWVDTEMGHDGARIFDAPGGPPDKVSVTIPQLVDQIEKGTREREGGRMINYDGTLFDW